MIDLFVIGSGPAGIEAAYEARKQQLSVALASITPPGGRSAMGSLLPSKVWLHAAERYVDSRPSGGAAGAAAGAAAADFGDGAVAQITAEIAAQQRSWSGDLADELERIGVRFHRAKASITGPTTVALQSLEDGSVLEELEAGAILIATGSEPRFAPTVKPDGERIIAPRHTQMMKELPERIVFSGGGVTSTEYAAAFARLGSRVTIVTKRRALLPRAEAEVSERLSDYLQSRLGVTIVRGSPVQEVKRDGDLVQTRTEGGDVFESDYAFIATGRGADTELLGDGVSLKTNSDGSIEVDEYGQTSEPTIYAAGDVTGAPLIANKARWEARVAVRAIAGAAIPEAMLRHEYIEAVYTAPQVAQIGPVRELPSGDAGGDSVGSGGSRAADAGRGQEGAGDSDVAVLRRPFDAALLARIDHADDGLLKVWVQRSDGRILGAAAFAPHAAELMAPIQLAMQHGIAFDDLSAAPFAHPTLSELLSL